MEIIGIVLFCAVILASAKLMLDPPDRKKDPKEDEEQIEFLNEWNKPPMMLPLLRCKYFAAPNKAHVVQ